MLPQVGQTVLVNMASRTNKAGKAFLTPSRSTVQTITQVYRGGHVKTSSGDIWKVKPLPTSKADFKLDEAASG